MTAAATATTTAATTASLKEQKEAFVTGHDGTTPWEVLLVCLSAPISLACYRAVIHFMHIIIMIMITRRRRRRKRRDSTRPKAPASPKIIIIILLKRFWHILLEAMLVWFPMVLCQTNYLYPYGVGVMILQLSVTAAAAAAAVTTTTATSVLRQAGVEEESSSPITDIATATTTTTNNTTTTTTTTTNASQKQQKQKQQQQQQQQQPRRLDFLTAYRSSIFYLTFIAILAVDFHVFPRRFCKTEVAGFGLMDVGAASFCLSAGLVSPTARGRGGGRRRRGRGGGKSRHSSSILNFRKLMLHTMPLVVLGILRIVTNRELEYQEHVSEYGVHWNFFFTMGVLALVPPLLASIIITNKKAASVSPSSASSSSSSSSSASASASWKVPAVIMLVYQIVLSLGGGQDFIETAPRQCPSWTENDKASSSSSSLSSTSSSSLLDSYLATFICHFFFANREGILGCLGYLSLYFFGEWLGWEYLWKQQLQQQQQQQAMTSQQQQASPSSSASSRPAGGLFRVAVGLWILLGFLHWDLGIPISRRSTNATFCIWAAARNVTLLTLLQWTIPSSSSSSAAAATTSSSNLSSSQNEDVIVDGVPLVWDTVNRYGLVMFLIANLLTGLVNLTVPTLEMSDPAALAIVFGYICAVGMAALLLDILFTRRIIISRWGWWAERNKAD